MKKRLFSICQKYYFTVVAFLILGLFSASITDVSAQTCSFGVQVSSNSPVCIGTSLNVSTTVSPPGNYTYSWKGPGGFTISVQDPQISVIATDAMMGTYTVSVIQGNCTVTQTVNISKTASCTNTCAEEVIQICENEKAELTAEAGFTNYQWYRGGIDPANLIPGATSQVYTTNQPGTCYYTALNPNGCPVKSCCGVKVEVIKPAKPTLIASKYKICKGESITLTASGCTGGTYVWQPNIGSGNSVSISPIVTGTYSVKCQQGTCLSDLASVVVEVSEPVVLSAASNSPVCLGTPINLTATPTPAGSYTYSWAGPNNFTSNAQNPLVSNSATNGMAGTYTVAVVQGGCTVTQTVGVSIKPNCTATCTNTAVQICYGEKVELTADAGYTNYQWYKDAITPANLIAGATSQIYLASETGTYYYTAQNPNGCPIQACCGVTLEVTKPPKPTLVASKPKVCKGESVTLTASGCTGGTYIWQPNIGSGNSVSISPIVTGTYSVKCQQGTCLSDLASVLVEVAEPATLIANSNSPVCFGGTITLTATSVPLGAYTYSWAGPNGYLSSQQNPVLQNVALNNSGVYSVSIGSGACSATATVSVQVKVCTEPCTIDVATSSICHNQGTIDPTDDKWSVTLTVTGGPAGGTWTAYYGVMPLGTGTYNSPNNVKTFDMGLILNFPVSPVLISVRDNQSPTCTTKINAEVPKQCSTDKCQLCIYTRRVRCTSTGLFFDLVVSNSNNEPWKASIKYIDGTSTTILNGNLDGTYSIGPLDLSKLGTGFMVSAKLDNYAECVRNEFVSIPCQQNNQCNLSATYTNVQIDPANGVFTFDLTVTSINSGSWTAFYGGQTWTGIFGNNPVTIGPFPVSVGAVNVAIIDKNNPNCIVNVGAVKPNCLKNCVSNPTKPSLVASPASICEGECSTLSASGCAGGTIVWYGTATPQVCPTATSVYRATCLKDGCMSDLAEVTVTVQPRPTPPTVSISPINICSGEAATLTASGCAGGTIVWYKKVGTTNELVGSNPANVFPTTTTTYIAKCKLNGCEGFASNEVKVNVNQPNPISIAVSPSNIICSPRDVTMTVLGCVSGTVTWDNGALGETLIKNITQTSTFTATCTMGNCKATASTTITLVPNIIFTVNASPQALCKPQSITFVSEGCPSNGFVTWSNGQVGTNMTAYVSETVTYIATCKIGNCETKASATVTVHGDSSPFTITPSQTTACLQQPVTITANGCDGGLVTWWNGQTGNSVTFNFTGTSTYTATCKVGGCNTPATTTITTSNNITPPTLSGGGSICLGKCLTLLATNCAGILIWSDGSSATVCPTQTTTYRVKCKIGACESDWSNGVTVTIKDANSPDCEGCNLAKPIINPVTVCVGQTTELCASNCAGTLEWSNGQTGSCISIAPNVSTTYTVRCRIGTCYSPTSDPAQITITRPTLPIITCSNTSICSGESAILNAANCNGTVNWYKQIICVTTPCNPLFVGTGNPFTITPDATTTYVAKCKIGNCESEVSNEITIRTGNSLSAPIISANTTSLCIGGSAILKATACAGTIVWSNGQTGTEITVSPVGDTDYTAICQTDKCKSNPSNIIRIKVGSGTIAAPLITCGKETICEGESVIFKGHNCDSGIITWYANGTQVGVGLSIVFTPSVTTNYTATCTMGTCVSGYSTPAKITVLNGSSPTITANRTDLCGTETATLTASACAGTLTWYRDGTQVSTGQTYTTNNAGVYTAKCSGGDCPSKISNAITIAKRIVEPPLPVIENKVVCLGSQILLDAGCDNPTWSNGQTGRTISITPTGITTITARCSIGCGLFATKQWNISIKEKVLPIITCKEKVCKNESVAFGVTGCTGTPSWSNGAIGNSTIIMFSTIGEQTVKVSCMTDCGEAESTKTISVYDDKPAAQPIITATKENICAGQSISLSVQNCDSPVWNTGETKTTITVTPAETSTYTVKCKFVSLCTAEQVLTASKTIYVTKVETPELTCVSDDICPGESVTISATGCTGGKLIWSNGATTQTITVSPQVTTTYTAICRSGDCVSQPGRKEIRVGSGTVLPPVLACGREIVCPGDEVVFTAYACTGTINWLSGSTIFGTGKSITVKPTTTTTYTAVCKNGNCISPAATPITITVTSSCNETVDVCINKVGDKQTAALGDEVTYTVVVKNKGPKEATNTEWCDTLPQGLTFLAATNCTYANGKVCARIPSLANGDSTIFRYTVKVTTAGKIVNKAEILRVDQKDANGQNNISSFILNQADTQMAGDLLGLTKTALTPKQLSTGVYEVAFTITVHNMGTNTVKNVQVKDDLIKAMPAGAVIMTNKTELTADAGFAKNAKYDGLEDKKMLDASNSEIPAGAKRNIYLKVVVDVSKATSSKLVNEAQLEAGMDGNCKDDSNNTSIPDPDGDNDPTNNNNPTTVDLPLPTGNATGKGVIGLALSVVDSLRQDNGTYNLTYMGILKNFGDKELKNVQVSDSLSKTFMNGASCRVIGTPIVSRSSSLVVNAKFDGENNTALLIAESSKLAASKTDTVLFSVNVFTNGQTSPFLNNMHVSAKFDSLFVEDMSTDGTVPEPAGNTPTAISLRERAIDGLTIPDGLSPNGDGINDTFVIKGAKQSVELKIYNRWGNLVYQQDDYKNDWGGDCNTGIMIGHDTRLPDGTYYYYLKVGDAKPVIRFVMIAR